VFPSLSLQMEQSCLSLPLLQTFHYRIQPHSFLSRRIQITFVVHVVIVEWSTKCLTLTNRDEWGTWNVLVFIQCVSSFVNIANTVDVLRDFYIRDLSFFYSQCFKMTCFHLDCYTRQHLRTLCKPWLAS
jgi:hypothetical protein